MKLTDNAQQILISKEQKALRTVLALKLDFTERWILKCAHENKENGPLTTMAAMRVIRQETGLRDEQILEESEVATA